MEIDENSTYQYVYTKLASELHFDEKSKVEVKNRATNGSKRNSEPILFFTQSN